MWFSTTAAFWDWQKSKSIRGGIPRDASTRLQAKEKNVAAVQSLFVTPDGKRLYTLVLSSPSPNKTKSRIRVWDLDRAYDPKLPKGKVEPSPEPRP